MTAQILIGSLLTGDIPAMSPSREMPLASSAHVSSQPVTPVRLHLSRSAWAVPALSRRMARGDRYDLPSALFHPPTPGCGTPPGA